MSANGKGAAPLNLTVPVSGLYKSTRFAGDPDESLWAITTDLFFATSAATVTADAGLVAASTLTTAVSAPVGVGLTAASTLTATAINTVLPTVALVATSSLTTAVSGVLSATASLAATSSLTATAVITKSGAAALVAASTLTSTIAPATVASLTAASSLTTDAATPVTAAVALSAASTLTITGAVVVVSLSAVSNLSADAAPVMAAVALVAASTLTVAGVVIMALGAVTVVAGPVTALVMAQPGTLANPYAASDSDTRSIAFASALFVATEPVAITGPPAAPSVWYEFTESQVADWLASTSSFAHGAVIELYTGPHGATADDLTFIATDGSSLVTLGAVTLSALVTTVVTSLRVELVDVGTVAVAASPVLAMALS